jgi:hypothetical protein
MALLCTKYAEQLGLNDEDIRILMFTVLRHDRSKFSYDQFYPYIELTEYFRQKKTLGNKEHRYESKAQEEMVNEAIQEHYRQENHHPEKLSLEEFGPSRWTITEALECACDLQAMAQEFKEGTFKHFFENVWIKKQGEHFTFKNFKEVTDWMKQALLCFEDHQRAGE